ncbi:MAG: sialidase family protein, partial [Anaerolineae bacterium]
ASDGAGTLFAVWEDGRNGGVFNRDIYFSRSTDGGNTWLTPNVRVNDYVPVSNQIRPDLVYEQSTGRLYAVWQDERSGNFDIYLAYSDDLGDTWSSNQMLNDDVGTEAQLNPSIAIGRGALGPGNRVYVAWQDQRNGNDDIYLVRSDDGGANWSSNYFVTDDPDMTAQNQAAPSVAVENVRGYVVVAWEDWRDPLHPEIYAMWSQDEGQTFGIDVPVTIVAPEARNTYRRAPTLATETTTETIEYWDEIEEITKTLTTGITAIHVAWEDGPLDQTDIYYAYAYYAFELEAREECPYPYEAAFCFQAPQKISGTVVDSDYVRPPGDSAAWPIEPSWQGQVSMALVPAGTYTTGCHADSTQDYSRGVILAWSDARSFDEWRYEIHTRRIASPGADPRSFEPCEDWAWGMVNDNTKLYALRDDPTLYEIYKPAATGQFWPAILVDPDGVFVAWDDDRYDDPTVAGTVRNRDVFMAEMTLGVNTEGIFISPVFDGRKDEPKWYVLSWWAVTELGGDVMLQTRFSNNPVAPPAGGGWTDWTGNPSSSSVGCSAGAGCYYDAPGRHIVDPAGDDWFGCSDATCPGPYRYMQYKVILTGPSRRTALSRVVVHYEGLQNNIYLPIVVRNYP